jgi:hypothetical protein
LCDSLGATVRATALVEVGKNYQYKNEATTELSNNCCIQG